MSEEFTPPRTRREWLMQERARLYKALNDAIAGYDDLVSGRIQSYSLGTRSITRYTPDLNALSAFITQTQNRIAEIEARTEELFLDMEEAETFLKENQIEQ